MKKALSLSLAILFCLNLCACGSSNDVSKNIAEEPTQFIENTETEETKPRSFELAQLAYTDICKAHEIVEKYGDDVYEIWRLGISNKVDIITKGCKYLDLEINLSEDEIRLGVAHWATEYAQQDWDNAPEESKKQLAINADSFLALFANEADEYFFHCLKIVRSAYIVSGLTEEATQYMDSAKATLRQLEEIDPEYEYYNILKDYYISVNSFFEFCQNPTGSFELAKDTINEYKNTVRNYSSELDFEFAE